MTTVTTDQGCGECPKTAVVQCHVYYAMGTRRMQLIGEGDNHLAGKPF